ncbi:type II toxin-antitoxin system HicB family antitoxin [Desulfonema magnum]|uniref:Type II toxin-antitoxin system HicB family antitoxin n=1 Tax=Desulfonema magnum TaxID=45655 RepID=A0A975BL32_9BACT|nr:type II toxin-antitoxin system HicB family antitoxin [Desulfonema magnum]QTA87085.1 Uncharacterized protein dnm_031130 [Desulfonema magnum]
MKRHFTAVIIKSGDWFAGTVKELSGVHTQGKTIDEVRENLKEAITMVIESNIRHFTEASKEYIEEDIVVNL